MSKIITPFVRRRMMIIAQIITTVGVFLSWARIIPLYELVLKTNAVSGELWLSGWVLIIFVGVFLWVLFMHKKQVQVRGAVLTQWHQLFGITILELVVVVLSLSMTMGLVAGYDDAVVGPGGFVCLGGVLLTLLLLYTTPLTQPSHD